MKKKVLLRGPVLTQSGYGVHCRQVAKWLLQKEDIDVKFNALPWGETPWYINPNSLNGLIGKIMERSIEPKEKFDVSIQLQLPNEWNNSLAEFNIGMTAGVETDKCNPAWINCINGMQRVIVPSTHVKKCFENTGNINVSCQIIPESYPDTWDDSLLESKEFEVMDFSTDFNFLILGQLTGNNAFNDRKNMFFTIKWICETFKDDKNVGIVIKTNIGRNTILDRKNVINLMSQLIGECRQGPYPKIHLIHGEMSDNEIYSLYKNKKIKALVAATRGEGYGLPILEAAVCGIPVITTGWSGHMDFMSKGKFVNLDFSLENIHPSRVDGNIFLEGMKWAFPKEEDFKKKIQKFRSFNLIPNQWANSLSQTLKEEYSFQKICKSYDEFLGDII